MSDLESCLIDTLCTSLERMRCRQPSQESRIRRSLSAHGQLTPLVATQKPKAIELVLVDGFKRLRAAKALGWSTLRVSVRSFDDKSQILAMIHLNRGPHSMTMVEEALALCELAHMGMSQTDIAGLVNRHKTWVCRRMGLIEKLHPELVESIKLGLLTAGVARQMLSLPHGNQLQIAAAAQSARLGPRDTELLVSLWKKTPDPSDRAALLRHPRVAIQSDAPRSSKSSPINPKLSPTGQRAQRALQRLQTNTYRTIRILKSMDLPEDQQLLKKDIAMTKEDILKLSKLLGTSGSAQNAVEPGGNGETA